MGHFSLGFVYGSLGMTKNMSLATGKPLVLGGADLIIEPSHSLGLGVSSGTQNTCLECAAVARVQKNGNSQI